MATDGNNRATSLLEGASGFSSGPTTAVDLNNVSGLDPTRLQEETNSTYSSVIDDDEDLQNLLSGLMRSPNSSAHGTVFHSELPENMELIEISKTSAHFSLKLKHVFILSEAGKPIYLMNGSDDDVLGYMGIITTLATAQDGVRSILYDGVKILILNRSPLLLVAVTKISYEQAETRQDDGTQTILERQLHTLYDYLISMISRHTIERNFKNRMNYDLRRVLTPLDFHNLDTLCMKLTYGLDINVENQVLIEELGFSTFICELLDLSISCAKISNSTRQKLNNILLQSRKYCEDLLFGLVLYRGKILLAMKPKSHNLTNKDLKILLATVTNQQQQLITDDLWIPICMPHFNSYGFLYAFVRTENGVTVVLLSGNKNCFFTIQNSSQFINKELSKFDILLELRYSRISILEDIKVLLLSHFIFRLKACQQYTLSEILDVLIELVLQYVQQYSILHNTRAQPLQISSGFTHKRFSYCRFVSPLKPTTVGLMLSNDKYEFYCLSDSGKATPQELIKAALKVIKWCEKYHRRLFIDHGVVF